MDIKNDVLELWRIIKQGSSRLVRDRAQIISFCKKYMRKTINKEITKTFGFLFFVLLFSEAIYGTFLNTRFGGSKVLLLLLYSMFLSLLILFLRKGKGRRIVLLFITLFINGLYFGEALYFSNFKSFALWSRLSRLDDLFALRGQVGEYVKLELFCFFIPFICLVLFYVVLMCMKKWGRISHKHIPHGNKEKSLSFMQKFVPLVFVVLAISMVNVFNVYGHGDTNKIYLKDSVDYVRQYGLFDAFVMNSLQSVLPVFKEAEPSKESIERAFRFTPETNNYTDLYKDKNLVFIEGESVASYAIDPVLTPTLYRLQQEGYSFDNYYAPFGLTIESEHALMNSFYLTPEKEAESFSSKNSMPGLFHELDYSTQAFHNFFGNFYGRDKKMPELGFDQFYDMEALRIPARTEWLKWSDFPSDEMLFANSIPHIVDKEKFLAYYITMSAHGGYDITKRASLQENFVKVDERFPDYSTEIKTYLAGVMLTDQGVGRLYEELEHSGQLEDTVIIFVGDHYPKILQTEDLQQTFNIENEVELQKPAFFIWDSSHPAEVRNDVMSNVDVLPTVANLFGLDLKYAMGQDMFSTKVKDVFVEWYDFRSYSFLTPEGGYDGLTGQIIGDLSEEKLNELKRNTHHRESMNNSVYLRELLSH